MGPFHRAVLADAGVRAELEAADRIELQWFRSIVLAPRLRRLYPETPIVGVFHDVVSQGYARKLRARHVGPAARLLSLLRLLLAVPRERRAMRTLDTAVVLSEKDETLLQRRRGTARIVVVFPPLDDEDMPSGPRVQPPAGANVLFVGALWRSENEDAALWLLRDIWPRIRAAVPAARLTIAGVNPSPLLRREAARCDDVEVTGYVESLSPYYRRASTVVAPLRLGAGVKLKTVVAMLWGVPVVATGVAAEGVAQSDAFLALADDAESFAKAVIASLDEPRSALEVSARAYAWAHSTYSVKAYRRALDEVYA